MKISEALLIILFMGLATLIYFHDYLYLPNIKLTTYCMQYACYDCANFQVQNEGLTSKTKFLANKDIHLSVFYDGYTPLEEF